MQDGISVKRQVLTPGSVELASAPQVWTLRNFHLDRDYRTCRYENIPGSKVVVGKAWEVGSDRSLSRLLIGLSLDVGDIAMELRLMIPPPAYVKLSGRRLGNMREQVLH